MQSLSEDWRERSPEASWYDPDPSWIPPPSPIETQFPQTPLTNREFDDLPYSLQLAIISQVGNRHTREIEGIDRVVEVVENRERGLFELPLDRQEEIRRDNPELYEREASLANRREALNTARARHVVMRRWIRDWHIRRVIDEQGVDWHDPRDILR